MVHTYIALVVSQQDEGILLNQTEYYVQKMYKPGSNDDLLSDAKMTYLRSLAGSLN